MLIDVGSGISHVLYDIGSVCAACGADLDEARVATYVEGVLLCLACLDARAPRAAHARMRRTPRGPCVLGPAILFDAPLADVAAARMRALLDFIAQKTPPKEIDEPIYGFTMVAASAGFSIDEFLEPRTREYHLDEFCALRVEPLPDARRAAVRAIAWHARLPIKRKQRGRAAPPDVSAVGRNRIALFVMAYALLAHMLPPATRDAMVAADAAALAGRAPRLPRLPRGSAVPFERLVPPAAAYVAAYLSTLAEGDEGDDVRLLDASGLSLDDETPLSLSENPCTVLAALFLAIVTELL